MTTCYVLINPPRFGIGHPLGVYSSLQLAEQAVEALGADCLIQVITMDEPADYGAYETQIIQPLTCIHGVPETGPNAKLCMDCEAM